MMHRIMNLTGANVIFTTLTLVTATSTCVWQFEEIENGECCSEMIRDHDKSEKKDIPVICLKPFHVDEA